MIEKIDGFEINLNEKSKRIINIENNLYQVGSDNNSYNSEVNSKFFSRKEIQGKVLYKFSTKLF